MSGLRYIRNSATRAVLLSDPQAVAEFRQKQTVTEEIQVLKAEINSLKAQLAELRSYLKDHHSE